ncbi:MCP four helix bundle domain-containing protein, partial [Prochlorothrix hollandica]|uniref:MCP four helix bundle domain-containing protein n=1 Tax=Prochlorothrix hollandica TaxID=1223 RepID=UPI0033411013
MLQNQSMESRLKLAFGFMGVLILIMAIFGWSSSERLGKHINTLSYNTLPSIDGLWKINEGQTQIQSSERILLSPGLTVEERSAAIAAIDNAWKQIDEGFEEYQGAPQVPGEEDLVNDFKPKWDTWEKKHIEFLQINQTFENLRVLSPFSQELELLRSGQGNSPQLATIKAAQEAFIALESQSEDSQDDFQAATDALLQLIQLNQDAADTATFNASEDVAQSRFWGLVGICIGPVTAFIFGIFFSNTIAKPLGHRIAGVVVAAQKISAGDLRSSVDQSEQQDELGQLQNAFHKMQG